MKSKRASGAINHALESSGSNRSEVPCTPRRDEVAHYVRNRTYIYVGIDAIVGTLTEKRREAARDVTQVE